MPTIAVEGDALTQVETYLRETITGREIISADEFADVLLDIRGEFARSGDRAGVISVENQMRKVLTGRKLIGASECADVLLDIKSMLTSR